MSHGIWLRLAASAFVCVTALTACGGSSSGSASPAPTVSGGPVATLPSPTAASRTCPTAARVGSALGGITLPKPVGVAASGASQFPSGAKAIVCEYHAQTYNVIIEILTNIDGSYIAQFSIHFPVPYATVPGVGDQARSFSVSIGGGKVNEGVVASKGSTIVSIGVTAAPVSLGQIEALINQLL